MATERSLTLSFSLDAWETWENVVNSVGTMFVRILPVGGGAPFDAWLHSVDDETGDVHGVRIIRGAPDKHPHGPIETVRAEKIHVY